MFKKPILDLLLAKKRYANIPLFTFTFPDSSLPFKSRTPLKKPSKNMGTLLEVQNIISLTYSSEIPPSSPITVDDSVISLVGLEGESTISLFIPPQPAFVNFSLLDYQKIEDTVNSHDDLVNYPIISFKEYTELLK